MFLFCHSDLNIRYCLHVFFCNQSTSSGTFVLDKSFNCSLIRSNSLTHLLLSLNKSCNDKHHRLISSQIKLDNTTILWVFLLILILNLPYHQTHIADELTYIIAKVQLEATCYCTITILACSRGSYIPIVWFFSVAW